MATNQTKPPDQATSSSHPKHYTWHRTPSQIVYEVAACPVSIQQDEAGQIDSTGNPDTRQPTSKLGLLYMFIGISSLAAMSFLSKMSYASNSVTPLEVAYARFLGIILGNVIVSCFSGHTVLEVATGLEKSLLLRALAGTFAQICNCYALFMLDCSMAITLNITNYFMITMISLCQKYAVTKAALLVCGLSLTGIAVLMYTGGFWTIIPIMGSLGMVLSYLIVKQIKSEVFYIIPPTYLGVCGAIISSWGLLYWNAEGKAYVFSDITRGDAVYLAAISLTGWASVIFQSWALQEEMSWRTTAMTYMIVGYAFAFDLVEGYRSAFGIIKIIGTLLLVGSNFVYSIFG